MHAEYADVELTARRTSDPDRNSVSCKTPTINSIGTSSSIPQSSFLNPHQLYPMIPCLSTCACLTNPTLLPITPSPPTPKSNFLGKLNDCSIVVISNGNACNIDVAGASALRSPSLLHCLLAIAQNKTGQGSGEVLTISQSDNCLNLMWLVKRIGMLLVW